MINEGRDEVTSGFNGENKSGFQSSSQAQEGQSKLIGWPDLLIVTHIDLSKVLHVVNIQSHHMTQSVWEKEGMSPGSNSRLDIPLHKADLFKPPGKGFGSHEMDVAIEQSGFDRLNRFHICLKNRFVHRFLPAVEFTANRDGSGQVGGVSHFRFTTGIYHHHPTRNEGLTVIMVV